MNNKVAIFSEEYVNDKTGDKAQGITIIVDGKLREVFDRIIFRESKYQNYTEIVQDALFSGIDLIIGRQKKTGNNDSTAVVETNNTGD